MSTRGLYIALLRLHPAGFRGCFAEEMLRDYDDACASFGEGWLLRDALSSLLRQRFLRWTAEPLQARFGLLAGGYSDLGPPHVASALALLLAVTLPCFFLIPPPPAPVKSRPTLRPEYRLEFSYRAPERPVAGRRRR